MSYTRLVNVPKYRSLPAATHHFRNPMFFGSSAAPFGSGGNTSCLHLHQDLIPGTWRYAIAPQVCVTDHEDIVLIPGLVQHVLVQPAAATSPIPTKNGQLGLSGSGGNNSRTISTKKKHRTQTDWLAGWGCSSHCFLESPVGVPHGAPSSPTLMARSVACKV